MHKAFNQIFPALDQNKPRIVQFLPDNEYNIPTGRYILNELHCVEDNCDCRFIYISVHKESGGLEANISFGWESIAYYAKWMGCGKKDPIIKETKGPSVNNMQQQGPHARAWLKYVKNILLTDHAYVASIKEHYKMVKGK